MSSSSWIYWEINPKNPKHTSNKKPFKTYVLKGLNVNREIYKAEEQGFEPRDLLKATVFKTDAIDHSAIPPVKWFLIFSGANIKSFCLPTKYFFDKYPKNLVFKGKNLILSNI